MTLAVQGSWFMGSWFRNERTPSIQQSAISAFPIKNHTTSLRLWKCTPSACGISPGGDSPTDLSLVFKNSAALHKLCAAPSLRTTHYAFLTLPVFSPTPSLQRFSRLRPASLLHFPQEKNKIVSVNFTFRISMKGGFPATTGASFFLRYIREHTG